MTTPVPPSSSDRSALTWYTPGTGFGVVARSGCIVLAAPSSTALVVDLWSDLDGVDPFSRVLTRLMSADSAPNGPPEFAVVVFAGDAVQVAVRGSLRVQGRTAAEEVTIAGTRALTWCEEVVQKPLSLSIGLTEASDPPSLPLNDGIARLERLDISFVRANGQLEGNDGVALAIEPPAPTDEVDDHDGLTRMVGLEQLTDQPADNDGLTRFVLQESLASELADNDGLTRFVPSIVDAAEETTAPESSLPGSPIPLPDEPLKLHVPGAPQVLAQVCQACGCANPTRRSDCRGCGRELVGDAQRIPRPTLGRLRLPSGEVRAITRPLVLGRQPQAGPNTAGDLPDEIVVDDPHVSGTHLRVDLEDWSVVVTSLGRNGTLLRRRDEPDRRFADGEQIIAKVGDIYCVSLDLYLEILELS